MATACELKKNLQQGVYDALFISLYGVDMVEKQRARYAAAIEAFEELFPTATDLHLFSAPGRTEIGGNHTDHNHGRVLAGSIDLDVIAVAAPTDSVICVKSEGYPMDETDLADLEIHPEEEGKSAALLRGTAAGFKKNGYNVGGFCAYTTSCVLKGSGLSSSAAFEVLCGTVLNHLYNNAAIKPQEIAQIAQYAENVYFGKPCGLLDQTASAMGGIVAIDFADTSAPVIEQIAFDFAAHGIKLCVVDSGGNHADLTPEYAAVPKEMKAVAAALGVSVLQETSREALLKNLAEIRATVGDRAVLRALHFFAENERVLKETAALKAADIPAFFEGILSSGHSSFEYLQNVYPTSAPHEQGLSLALCLAQRELEGNGAWRVHGGGFAGTTLNFVPTEKLAHFCETMESAFGKGSCYVLNIRPYGGICLDTMV